MMDDEDKELKVIDIGVCKNRNYFSVQQLNVKGPRPGIIQLYAKSLDRYQPKLTAFGGVFALFKKNGKQKNAFCFARADGDGLKLYVIELRVSPDDVLMKKISENFTLPTQTDYIISIVPCNKREQLYLVTHEGSVILYDMKTVTNIGEYRCKNDQVKRCIIYIA